MKIRRNKQGEGPTLIKRLGLLMGSRVSLDKQERWVNSEINRTRPCVKPLDHDKEFGFVLSIIGSHWRVLMWNVSHFQKSGLLQLLPIPSA